MKNKHQDILFIILLLSGIAILFLNDRIWKYEYGTWFTGKLSDFTGLLTLPIFISLIYPKTKQYSSFIIGILFMIWKSPISDPFIANWNALQIFELSRVIDPTDFFALLLLPIAHLIVTQYDLYRIRQLITTSVHQIVWAPALVMIGIIFCSTSILETAYPKGDVLIDESYQIKGKSESQILSYLESNGMKIRTDSILYLNNSRTRHQKYYQIDSFILLNGLDTLKNVNFRIYETANSSSIHIINFSVPNDWDLQNWKTLKWKTKRYKEMIKEQIIRKIESV